MKVGFDYWQVISHYPDKIGSIMARFSWHEDEICVISAIGRGRIGTVEREVRRSLDEAGWDFSKLPVYEVLFDNPSQSPELKLAKCQELGVDIFFDDRDDVCRLLNKNGILALRVTRKDNSTYDLGAERTDSTPKRAGRE